MALSPKQESILSFIDSFMAENGYPPTVRDIQKGCDLSSTSVVDYNLRALDRLGYLRRTRDVSRGIELARRSKGSAARVPILGVIAAGEPLSIPTLDPLTLEDSDMLEVSEEMVQGQGDVFALRVQGQSMIDALIGDGDLVILRRTDRVQNGDMVAAWLPKEESTTLKRFYKEGDRVRLQPENKDMEPIYVDASEVEVHGKVIALVRRYF